MKSLSTYPQTRLRRLRQHKSVRDLIRETHFDVNKLILPLFIKHGSGTHPIHSMPGHFQIGIDQLATEIEEINKLGIKGVIVFGIPAVKDKLGEDSYSSSGVIQSAIPIIKKTAPKLLIFSDICLCEYTDHGHCGFIGEHECMEELAHVDNDKTLELLAKQAVSHAQAGSHIIAPSGCMDGKVKTLRHALDEAGFHHIPILSYSVKYASSLYAPFREAAEGMPKFGDRRTYQMDFANTNEALRECALDIAEGADMLMVKPAHTYLDVICRVKQNYPEVPLCAYHTSGEFAMLKAASQKNWIDERQTVMEVLTSIRRAGADFIITYYAKEVAHWMQNQE